MQPTSTNCPACGGPNDLGSPNCSWCGAPLVVPPGVRRLPPPPPPQARMPAPPPPPPRYPPPYGAPKKTSGCTQAIAGCLILCGVIFVGFFILGMIGMMIPHPSESPSPAPAHTRAARPHATK